MVAKEAADPSRRRFDAAANRGHLGVVGGRRLGCGGHVSMMANRPHSGGAYSE
jgi:hypothetical protein